jgi:hypothetical protein
MMHADAAHFYGTSSVPAIMVEAPQGTDILGALWRSPSELNASRYFGTDRALPDLTPDGDYGLVIGEALIRQAWITAIQFRREQCGDGYQTPQTAVPVDVVTDTNRTYQEAQATLPIDRVIGRLRSYKGLEPNWNGYGGQQPSGTAVEDAVEFLRMVGPVHKLPKTMVGGSGEVGLFWETSETYIEVGFRGDGTLGFLVDPADGDAVEAEGLPVAFPRGLLAQALAAIENA